MLLEGIRILDLTRLLPGAYGTLLLADLGAKVLKVELDELSPRTCEPFNLGVKKKGYPWSWMKKGVPYYCVHRAIWHEIMAIKKSGVPIKITDFSDDPSNPCRWYFYKSKEAIPEEFYTRLGLKKETEAKKEIK